MSKTKKSALTAKKTVATSKKVATPKKTVVTPKKVATPKKTVVTPKKVVTSKKTSGNKVLDAILQNIVDAKKAGAKSVVVFTTNETHYKQSKDPNGFGSSDLKPKVLEAYKNIFCNFDVYNKLVDLNTKSVEWVVKLK